MTDTLNLQELNNLSEEERAYALKILKELSKEGKSASLDNLKYSDYEEIPVDIETFLKDDNYLGYAWKDSEGNFKLFDTWLKLLKQLFPDNVSTSVNNAIFSGARGIGKSEVAVGIAAYLMYRLMCLKNPLEHFHLKPTEKFCFAFMNVKIEAAEEIANSKFQNTVKMSPWFLKHGTITGRTNRVWNPPDFIELIIGSQADDVIGKPIFFAFFDEISFIRNQDIEKQKAKAINMIDTAIGGMKSRFMYKGKNPSLLVLASSKRSEKSFLETHIKTKLKSEKENVLILDKPIWEVRPASNYSGKRFNVALGNKFLPSQVIPDGVDTQPWEDKGYKIISVPVEFKSNFLDDIERALCDYAGVSSSEISKYISGASVVATRNPNRVNPFSQDVIEVGNDPEDKAQYYDYFDLSKVPAELKSKPLFIHLDMSVSGDKTGIAGVWIKGKKHSVENIDQANDLYYALAFNVSVKAPKGWQVSFEKNKNFIYWLKEKGFRIRGISSDSFQSVETGQVLSAKGYTYQMISVDRVDPTSRICKPYQYLRTTIYEKRIETYDSKLLTKELTELERNINTGKVDHPENGSKDAADALAGSVYHASQYAEEFAYDYGENIESVLNANLDQSAIIEEQMIQGFQEMLQNNFNPIKPRTNQNQQQPKNPSKDYYLDFGMGKAETVAMPYLSQGIVVW